MTRTGPKPRKVRTLPDVRPGTATLRIGRVEINLPIQAGETIEETVARLLERMRQVQRAVAADDKAPKHLRQMVLFSGGDR